MRYHLLISLAITSIIFLSCVIQNPLSQQIEPSLQIAPTITSQPEPETQTVLSGQRVTFSIKAKGTFPLYYQWLKNDSLIQYAKSMALGRAHSMILKTDGTLWACGSNILGQLGIQEGTTPRLVVTGVISVAAGSDYTMILKTDQTYWAFGNNGNPLHNSDSEPSIFLLTQKPNA